MGYLYVLRFAEPLGNQSNPRAQAQYYLGYTSRKPEYRISQHMRGQGAAITRAARQRGIAMTVELVIPGCTRATERYYKQHIKSTPRLLAQHTNKHTRATNRCIQALEKWSIPWAVMLSSMSSKATT